MVFPSVSVHAKRGRPRKGTETGRTIPRSVRFPSQVWEQLDARAKAEGLPLHAAVRAAVLAWLERSPSTIPSARTVPKRETSLVVVHDARSRTRRDFAQSSPATLFASLRRQLPDVLRRVESEEHRPIEDLFFVAFDGHARTGETALVSKLFDCGHDLDDAMHRLNERRRDALLTGEPFTVITWARLAQSASFLAEVLEVTNAKARGWMKGFPPKDHVVVIAVAGERVERHVLKLVRAAPGGAVVAVRARAVKKAPRKRITGTSPRTSKASSVRAVVIEMQR